MRFYHFLTLLVALTVSACAAYYSIVGLTAIFAASVIPIIIMGTVLELAKITGAVWLKLFWHDAVWWLRFYLVPAIAVLMLITSMGIFGFLSRAHIEQTAAATEGAAQITRIEDEIGRQQEIISTAGARIQRAEHSVSERNQDIQDQIDTEQTRIDTAYKRIQPAINEQLEIVRIAREDLDKRAKPLQDQINDLDREIADLGQQAQKIEQQAQALEVGNSSLAAVRDQISKTEQTISTVQQQIASGNRNQIRQMQLTIGARPDGRIGIQTRRMAAEWVERQQLDIQNLKQRESQLLEQAQTELEKKQSSLLQQAGDLRTQSAKQAKQQRAEIIQKIDDLQTAEPPRAVAARKEIARIRSSADQQVAASQNLIQQLRDSLIVGSDPEVESTVEAQNQRIQQANQQIETLTEQRYHLQAEARKLEAEVGPIKYVAELIYGDADKDLLEQSVRWMILLLVAVFDPLAVILTLAAVTGLAANGKRKTNETRNTVVAQYDDTEIWQQVEQYNQQIRDLEQQKLDLENKFNAQDSLTQNQIEDIRQNITSVENQLSKKIQQVKNIAENPVVNTPVDINDLELLDVGTASFGTSWPKDPVKNDLFLKTDSNVLYRWNGRKWVEEDKGAVDQDLSYDYEFIKWLTGEVKKGKTTFEELSFKQKNQVKAYILKHGRKQ